MSGIFLTVLNLSINATWLILAVIILRFLMKKSPRWITCILWALVAVRLVCPFSPESVFSLLPSGEVIPPDITMEREPVIYTGIPAINDTVNPVLSEKFAPEPGDSANPLQILFGAAALVWTAGMILMLLYALLSFLLLKRKVRASIPVEERILICDEVKTPFILGMFRPVIYLPSSLSGQTFELVKAHEMAHIRRLDHWWKPLGFVLLSVYWFNPACWVAYILLCRDIEAACDEKVIKDKDRAYAAAYSEALLALSMPRRMITACPLAFGETDVKKRVKGVLNYKKPAFWVLLCALVGCVAVAVCFLTDPVADMVSDPVSENGEAQAEASAAEETDSIKDREAALHSSWLSGEFSEVPRPAVNLTDIEGSDLTQLLYADKDIIIFSDYYGLFVYSKSDGAVIAGLDLKPIGCNFTQGDNACEKFVSEDGNTVYLHPMTSEGMYVYQYKTDRLASVRSTMESLRLDGVKLHALPLGNETWHYGDYDEWTDNGKQMVTMLQHGGTIGELCYADFEKGQEDMAQYCPLFADGVSTAIDTGTAEEKNQKLLLRAYGALYAGELSEKSKTVMGDSGNIGGQITSSVGDGEIPTEDGQSNFGSVGNWYTKDFGDDWIEVFIEGEWYGFDKVVRTGDYQEPTYYYICGHDGDRLFLDEVEWITTGSERVKELGLTEDDMPGGFYVYNRESAQVPAVLKDACTFTILDWKDNYSIQQVNQVNKDTFLRILDERLELYREMEGGYSGPPYIIEMDEKGIGSIREQYVP